MITASQLHTEAGARQALTFPTQTRGTPAYPLDWRDIVDFARCPARWVGSPAALSTDPLSLGDLVIEAGMFPDTFPASFVRTPDTYTATELVCSSCGSVSATAKHCKACNLTRVSRTSTKPWSGTSTFARAWKAENEARHLTPVPAKQWDAAAGILANLAADPAIMAIRNNSAVMTSMTATWHDDASDIDIPLRSIIHFIPVEGNPMDNCIASFHLVNDISPGSWSRACYYSGLHIAAALEQAIWQHYSAAERPNHLWALAEPKEPYLVGRRRVAPELLELGASVLEDILAAYARCIQLAIWPRFDPASGELLDPWSPVYLDTWMTQADAARNSFFALQAPGLEPEPA